MPGSTAVINLIYDLNPKQTQPSRGLQCARFSPDVSYSTRAWENKTPKSRGGKSCRGMRAGRARALISHVCCCQTKCLCCWEVFPCLALSDSNWDFIYYHQIYHVMNTLGINKHIVGRMPNARTLHYKGIQCSLGWYTSLFLCLPESTQHEDNVAASKMANVARFLLGTLVIKETTGSKLHIKLLH